MTPLEAAYALFPPAAERFLDAVDFASRYQASRIEAKRIPLESDSATVWERAWKDATWWKDGEDTGGWT